MKIHNIYFDTFPVIFHHHGQSKWSNHSMGLPLKYKFFKEIFTRNSLGTFTGRKEKIVYPVLPINKLTKINEQITIFIVTNLSEKGSTAYCLDYFGIQYILVGSSINQFDGSKKYKEIIKFIPNIKTKYVMLLDSDDIFIIDELFNLVETYEKVYECNMLFQAESWNFPRGNPEMDTFEKNIVQDSNPYKHLNSGIWISNTKFLQSIYQDLLNITPHTPGDQPVFKEMYKMYYPDIRIDSNCVYFQSLAWSSWFENKYQGVLNLECQI